MPAENLRRLRAVYAAWAEGDFSAGTELFALDISFHTISDGNSTLAHDEIAGFMRSFLAQWDEFGIEAVEFEELGESILVTERQRGRGKSSGIEVEQTNYAIWTFRDGEVIRVMWVLDREVARATAGA